MDVKGVKRSVKIWATYFYNSFYKKYFVAHERWAVKNSLSIYVCTKGFYSCGVNCNLKSENPWRFSIWQNFFMCPTKPALFSCSYHFPFIRRIGSQRWSSLFRKVRKEKKRCSFLLLLCELDSFVRGDQKSFSVSNQKRHKSGHFWP